MKTSQHDKNNAAVFRVASETELLAFLLASNEGQGRNSVKALLAHKQVYVNGKNVSRHDHRLFPGDEVSIQKASVGKIRETCALKILYEDEYLIAVDKPSGMLSVGTETQKENTAYSHVNAYIKRTDRGGRIFLLHRLDRDTSGVILFAKDREIQQSMQNAWDRVITERLYHAVVDGVVVKDSGTIVSYLTEDANFNVHSSPVDNGGKRAVTLYRVLKRGMEFSLLELSLETGRKNQIRVHLQSIGHSVSGDMKYGGRKNRIGRLALHAATISFVHPVTGETVRVESPAPAEFGKMCH
jgi:23S rRNA pseudouridine1911/1915/1917 synthase